MASTPNAEMALGRTPWFKGQVFSGKRTVGDPTHMTPGIMHELLDDLRLDDAVDVYLLRASIGLSTIRSHAAGYAGIYHFALAFKRQRPYEDHLPYYEDGSKDASPVRIRHGWVLDMVGEDILSSVVPEIVSGRPSFNNQWALFYSEGIDVPYYSPPTFSFKNLGFRPTYSETLMGKGLGKGQVFRLLQTFLDLEREAVPFCLVDLYHGDGRAVHRAAKCAELVKTTIRFLRHENISASDAQAAFTYRAFTVQCSHALRLPSWDHMDKALQARILQSYEKLGNDLRALVTAVTTIFGSGATTFQRLAKMHESLQSRQRDLKTAFYFDGRHFIQLTDGHFELTYLPFNTANPETDLSLADVGPKDPDARPKSPPPPPPSHVWPAAVGCALGGAVLIVLVVIVVYMGRIAAKPV
jgi:hypothetical protein